jgi:hypothetical protein
MNTFKSTLGIVAAILWLVVYCGGGSFCFATYALRHPDHVPFYMPVLILLWIVGYFTLPSFICKVSDFAFKVKTTELQPKRWKCSSCGVTGTWENWESHAQPGHHLCDVCLLTGKPGKLEPIDESRISMKVE